MDDWTTLVLEAAVIRALASRNRSNRSMER